MTQPETELPPGPRDPRLNTFKWMVRPASILESSQRKFGDVWTLRMLRNSTFVVVSHPDLVKEIFTADPTVLHAGEANRMIGTALLGEYSVILLDEEEHTAQRKLLLPLFDSKRVERYRELMQRIAAEELSTWPLGEPLPLLERMQAITRKVIMSTIFGVTGGEAQDRLSARIVELLVWGAKPLKMAKLHRATYSGKTELPQSFLDVRDPFDAVVFEEIAKTRDDPRLEERDDILAMLVQARHDDGSPMSDREVRDEMVTLLIQGHTSTATALAWAIERLVRHPEMFERLRAEAEEGGDEYLDAVVKETLRLRPPLPVVMRKASGPYRLGDHELADGTVLAPCIYLLHLREDLYPEPRRFRPERFLEQPAGPYTWIPFGGGDRHCIGRSFAITEIKVVLRMLALEARLAPAAPRDEKVRKRGILLSPTDGARAVLEERVPAGAPSTETA